MTMTERFSIEEKMRLPEFKSAGDAYAYFRERWGRDFIFYTSEEIGEMDCWECHLILDRPAYTRGMRELQKGAPLVDAGDLAMSYQTFQLFDDGHVWVSK